jgi:hypothetical protein
MNCHGGSAGDESNSASNDGTLNIIDSTISGNRVSSSVGPGPGGGIYGGKLIARNTIIAGNTANQFPDLFGTLNSLACCRFAPLSVNHVKFF